MKLNRRIAEVDAGCDRPQDIDASEERRDHPRIFTVYRVARLSMHSDSGLCRVQNISNTGMMLVTGLAVSPGDSVMIALSDSVVIAGEVAWADAARIGIRFLEEIDVAEVLKAVAASAAAADQRPFRLPVDTVAVAYTPVGTRPVRVVDISQQGMKVGHDGSFSVGMQAKIELPNGLKRRGIVRWANETLAGLKLLEPIGYHELESASRL